jgi:hypothetical protein
VKGWGETPSAAGCQPEALLSPLLRLIKTAFMKCDVFWSLFAVPIGLLVCFGPALLAYALFGSRTPGRQESAPDEKSAA